MRHFRFPALVALSFAWAVAVGQPAVAQSKTEKIRELMEITQTEALVDALLPSMRVRMTQIISRVHPDIPDPVWDNVYAEAERVFRNSIADLIRKSIPIYERNFTEEEIDGMLAFYRTPVGRSVLEKMPQVLQESMMSNQQQLLAIGQEVQRHIFEKLADAGYKM